MQHLFVVDCRLFRISSTAGSALFSVPGLKQGRLTKSRSKSVCAEIVEQSPRLDETARGVKREPKKMSTSGLEDQQLSAHFSGSGGIRKSPSLSGKILIGITGGIAVGLSIVCYPFVAPALRKHCLPYVPATPNQIRNVLSYVRPLPAGSRLLDIGSGDGRIVIAAARAQPSLQADGVELNPWLVYYSRLAALRNGVLGRTRFFRHDLWKFSLAPYDHIVIFGVEQMMEDLEKKIVREVAPGTTIVACRFPFPTMPVQERIEEGVDSVWVYRPQGKRQEKSI
ncbi:ATP synthase subunit C lysine N-methyltransferase [Anopheles darlingi]|uniref:ATP synthase subunit C lysine N-methyltransferase n=1 Tax=Anopheles darlingi TaxID=43151 RepID=UPI0021003446|nr:ATP synthase subunit C lysine N-methyltransferase [Anopheles darlingi]